MEKRTLPSTRSCLTRQELEELVDSGPESPRADGRCDHVRLCPTCSRRLIELRSQTDLFKELRHSLVNDPELLIEDRVAAVGDEETPGPPFGGTGEGVCPPGYEILHEIHRGGQGVVFKAVQLATRRTVALKVLLGRAGDDRQRWRFEREIELVASLRHPNLVTVFDSGTFSGRAFYSMEFVDGLRLDQYLAGKELSINQKLELFLSIGQAVHFAHQHGVLHRDLKPGNILIDADGRPRVLDFGLAKAIDDSAEAVLPVTITGEFMGTLAYASPEQAGAGGGPVDVRTDVYSLGVLLYEMVAGRLPYDVSRSLQDTIRNITQESPARPSSFSHLIDADLETILLTALAKDRNRRYSSVEALIGDLQCRLSGRPIQARRDSAWYVLRKTIGRHRWAAGLACVIVLSLAALAVVMSVLLHQSREEAERARTVQSYLQRMLASAGSTELGPDVRFVDALQTAERFIQVELADQPRIEASLRLTLGRTYSSLWKWIDARRNLLRAQSLLEGLPDAVPTDLVECRLMLGSAMAELKGPRSLPVLRQALEGSMRLGDEAGLLKLSCRVELAHALTRVGSPIDHPEARRLLDEARAGYEQAGMSMTPAMAHCLSRSALLNGALGRLDEAQTDYQDSLRIFQALNLKADSHAMATALDYAQFLRGQGRFADAEAVMRDVLACYPATLSREQKPFILWQLAQLRAIRGDHFEAERFFRESIAMSCLKMAEKHPQSWEALNRCAIDLWSLPGAAGDVGAYVSAFELLQTLEGVPLPSLAQGMFDLATARLEQGDPSGAARLAQQCLQLRARVLAPGHAQTAAAQSLLDRALAGAESSAANDEPGEPEGQP